MKAYTQGEIDYFCGVYAVINACRQILKGKKYFSYNDGCLFYQHLMQYLIDAGKIGEVLHHGTDYDLILRLVEQGNAYAFQKFGVKISYELPYAQTVESFDAASKEIDRRLKEENASCIIRINNTEVGDHWSVMLQKTSSGKIKLFDSYAYNGFYSSRAVWLPENPILKKTDANPTGVPKPPKGITYVTKHGLIFLKA